MIPRGLAVAACIGVAAGAAAGIALHEKGGPAGAGAGAAGMPLSYVEGASLSVAVEKPDYGAGEAVRVTVANTGTVPLEFADGSFGLRVTQLDGIELYSPPPPPQPAAPAVLGPREEAVLSWDQTKSGGGRVLHGTYRISSDAAPVEWQAGGSGRDGGAGPAGGAAHAAAHAAGGRERIAASVTINILK